MASDSGQKFIGRNRKPRVHITYQDPYNAEQKIELPFVMGVMADLSGNTPEIEKADLAKRTFLDIDMDNFDKRMDAIKPGVSFHVENKLAETRGEKLSVQLNFRKMDDFGPAAIARQIPSLAKLLQARERLANLQRYMDGRVQVEKELKKLLSDPQLMAAVRNAVPSQSATSAAEEDPET
jgi:type VI secretion system protein ImpB